MSTIPNKNYVDAACKTFRGYRYHFQDTKAIEKVREAFAICQREIQNSDNTELTTTRLQHMEIALNSNRQEFDRTPWNPPLNRYPFFEFLQNLLLSTLQNVGQKSPPQETQAKIKYFDAICSLIDVFSSNFLFDDRFLSVLKKYLTDIRDNQYSPNDFRYAVVVTLFEQIYTEDKFKLKYYDFYQKLYPAVTTLILQCVLNYYEHECNRFYTEDQQRTSRTDGDAKHRVFLSVFPDYLLMADEEINRPTLTTPQLDTLCQTLFNWSHMIFRHIFKKQVSDHIFSNVLVRFLNLMNYCIPSVYFRRCIRQNLPLTENLLRLLQTPLFVKEITDYNARFGSEVIDCVINNRHYDLVITAVALLYNLSVESCVVGHLRALKEEDKPKILSVLNKDSKKNNKQTPKFHCQTLIGLMKDDIDNLEEPDEIAASYVKYMSKTMNKQNRSFQKVRLCDVIIHLKVFIQNEEVKTEVVAQDGLTLLTTCATESRFDIASVQYPSMELIWSIIFNLSASQLLSANKVFVDYVVDLKDSKTDKPANHLLKTVAEGVDWQMKQNIVKGEKRKEAEKPVKLNVLGVPVDSMGRQITKEQRLAMEQAKEFKFDLMISYCHRDAELCVKIHKGLKDTTNARVWIDTEQMFGSLTERMSEAIEHSRIILVCYSNAYKESANCQSECTYANDLKRVIIPLRMESNYRPNGWLKVIVGDRLYVDFVKYDFETAFGDLIKQLERYDKKYKETRRSQQPVNASASIAAAQSQKKMKEARIPQASPTLIAPQKFETQELNLNGGASSFPTNLVKIEDQSRPNSSAAALYESKQIIDWTKEDVQSFFRDKHIEVMLHLLDIDADGRALRDYYQQLMNEEKPYQLAKEELNAIHGIYLPLKMFVTFNTELQTKVLIKK
ncbi:unnamed protein product [Rotaria magnacalcarata]|uniref:TIR domain-containing protein n=2 Tax=Rotaria magnacalcarata TaxID=392030 RepID=A0A815LI66_9BILA|nr:unnamed protein product [Rotaria magnacalcarata]CAF1639749.1 unnamed protein product [Rotaria magnacalcarata]CAF2067979.1 unnamed protein product [Rotaria magnacalcarata]CAF4134721.1 unnamed protein product [Rotaria magnacalcarata]CAF4176953.1 unnamed protein product [Rotaria magnacalcarata]